VLHVLDGQPKESFSQPLKFLSRIGGKESQARSNAALVSD
jgi:hypothetical protein